MGLGSIAAAAKHRDVNVQKLITWKHNEPVPFSVLAQVLCGHLTRCSPHFIASN